MAVAQDFNMIAPSNAAPRRYFADEAGRRVLIGLTIEETREFEVLDRAQAELSASFVKEAAVSSSGLVHKDRRRSTRSMKALGGAGWSRPISSC